MNAVTHIEQHAITTQPAITAGPLANAIQALQAGMSVEQMRGLMDLQKDWEANEARKAYVADMAEFKRHPPEIYKTKLVAFSGTEYKHATLGDVTRAVVNELAKHGFSHSWETKQENGIITVTCKITHRLGHSESTTMESSADNSGKKNAIQAISSAVTYLQRYTLLGACGLATMDEVDDDGRGGNDVDIDYSHEGTVAKWTSQVNASSNLDSLRKIRGLAGEEFVAANDVTGWNTIKALVAHRAEALKASQ
jgi:ERF superfamily